MLLQILKSNQAYNLLLFPVIGIFLWSVSLISPEMYNFAPGEDQSILFKPILDLLFQKYLIQVLVSLVLIIILGFIIQKLNNQYEFYRIRTMLPSNLIILLISGVSCLHVLHPVFFAAIFFTFAIDREFGALEKKTINSNAFDTGLLIGIGSLFYINMIFMFPAFVIGLKIINRSFNWRNLILIFWGLILPWVFVFSYYFLSEKINELLRILELNLFTNNKRLTGNIPLQIYAGFWVFLLFIGSLTALLHFDEIKISTRKYYSVLLLLIFSIVIIYFLSPFVSVEIFILLAIPSTYILTNMLLFIRNRFIGNLILIVLIGLIIYMQIA